MRDVDFLSREIERTEEYIHGIPSKRLGFLLYSIQSYDGEFTRDKPLIVDRFEFHAHKHDTGVSVTVNVVDGDDRLAIINGTYWYSEACYGHNKFTRLSGAWDDALKVAQDKIVDMAACKYKSELEALKDEMSKLKQRESDKIAKFEEAFK